MSEIIDVSLSNEELLSRFVELATIHGQLRTPEEANQAFTDSVAVWGELYKRGGEAVEMFLGLLSSDTPQVRLAAAAKALFIAPEKAEPVLEQLATERRFLGVSAKMTLQEWRSGRLKPLI